MALIIMSVFIQVVFTAGCRFVLQHPVVDKETKMRETLKILSLKTSVYGFSYFISQAIFSGATAIMITVTFTMMGVFP